MVSALPSVVSAGVGTCSAIKDGRVRGWMELGLVRRLVAGHPQLRPTQSQTRQREPPKVYRGLSGVSWTGTLSLVLPAIHAAISQAVESKARNGVAAALSTGSTDTTLWFGPTGAVSSSIASGCHLSLISPKYPVYSA